MCLWHIYMYTHIWQIFIAAHLLHLDTRHNTVVYLRIGREEERVWMFVWLSCHDTTRDESDTLNLPRGFVGLWLEWRIRVLVAHVKQWVYGSVCQYISESVGFYFSQSRSAICFPWLPSVPEYSPDGTTKLCPYTKTITRAGTHPGFTHVLLLT